MKLETVKDKFEERVRTRICHVGEFRYYSGGSEKPPKGFKLEVIKSSCRKNSTDSM